ncbi:MAG TPA: hypothetical protein H9798_10125 [Candidatus Mediterraneibacter pullicola]|uniref:Uncharacterized protein n=1 Tax=Candidatus Mediterraneibacter pullicola TaxID=2838682 RepID=A0A9D2HAB7_9FIRM|nr:hypothetical protein [Candidatus Mediterraneibacter pullicola]
MEDGRKKIWICLFIIVLAAVVIGLIYYLSTPQEQAGEGFLIRDTCEQDGQAYAERRSAGAQEVCDVF